MPGENIYDWSTTAASNDDADTSINWREGQARASVNDSARSLMAAHAKQRDLLNGSIVTSGTADAQTFVSGVGYTVVPTGLRVLLKIGPALTNTTTATLNMDSIAAVTIKSNTGADLVAGALLAGSYCEFRYDGSNWILLRDTTDYVNVAGDTMTGDLTVPNMTATIVLGNTAVNSGGTMTAAGNTTVGGDLGVAGNALVTGTITALSHISNNTGNIQASGGNILAGVEGYKPGGGSWAALSDSRIKNVISDYSSGLATVKELQPVRYTFKGNNAAHNNVANKEFVGLIAQDVEPHMPEMVTQTTGEIDGAAVSDLRVLNTTALTFALVNCIKELLARIEALEAK